MRDAQKCFKFYSGYKPTGDQPQVVAELVKGIQEGNPFQTLLGDTGSGKTFTMASVIQASQKPTLVIALIKMFVTLIRVMDYAAPYR